jgi:hypothetical protein
MDKDDIMGVTGLSVFCMVGMIGSLPTECAIIEAVGALTIV